jgi:hypothetical protein
MKILPAVLTLVILVIIAFEINVMSEAITIAFDEYQDRGACHTIMVNKGYTWEEIYKTCG